MLDVYLHQRAHPETNPGPLVNYNDDDDKTYEHASSGHIIYTEVKKQTKKVPK